MWVFIFGACFCGGSWICGQNDVQHIRKNAFYMDYLVADICKDLIYKNILLSTVWTVMGTVVQFQNGKNVQCLIANNKVYCALCFLLVFLPGLCIHDHQILNALLEQGVIADRLR